MTICFELFCALQSPAVFRPQVNAQCYQATGAWLELGWSLGEQLVAGAADFIQVEDEDPISVVFPCGELE